MATINNFIHIESDVRRHGAGSVIGVLDIYGFEIFDDNRLANWTVLSGCCHLDVLTCLDGSFTQMLPCGCVVLSGFLPAI